MFILLHAVKEGMFFVVQHAWAVLTFFVQVCAWQCVVCQVRSLSIACVYHMFTAHDDEFNVWFDLNTRGSSVFYVWAASKAKIERDVTIGSWLSFVAGLQITVDTGMQMWKGGEIVKLCALNKFLNLQFVCRSWFESSVLFVLSNTKMRGRILFFLFHLGLDTLSFLSLGFSLNP
jgi:hypothetical protein